MIIQFKHAIIIHLILNVVIIDFRRDFLLERSVHIASGLQMYFRLCSYTVFMKLTASGVEFLEEKPPNLYTYITTARYT